MARCRRRGAAVSYHGDYRRRRLLAGRSITVSGRREAGEQREEGERSRKTDGGGQKTQSCASGGPGGAEQLWQDAGKESSTQTGRQEKNVLVWERAAGRSRTVSSGKILAFMGG